LSKTYIAITLACVLVIFSFILPSALLVFFVQIACLSTLISVIWKHFGEVIWNYLITLWKGDDHVNSQPSEATTGVFQPGPIEREQGDRSD